MNLHTNMTKIECGIITDKGVLGNDTKNVELVDGVLRLSDELFDLSEREFGNSIERGHSFNKEYVIELL